MRLFVALELPPDVRENIASLIGRLKPLDTSWKWTRAENLHVTLNFLGEVRDEDLPRIMEALRGVPFAAAILLKFRGLRFFPNERRPRVLWVGIDGPPLLPVLAGTIETALAAIHVPREERAFTPHLTLARSKEGRVSPSLHDALMKASSCDFGTTTASAFHLIRSELKSTGAEYTTLASFPCRQEAE